MWEITLIGQRQDYMHFLLFEKMIKSNYNNEVLVAISERTDTVCLSIAVNHKKLINGIKKLVLELIIKVCKEEFFIENLNINTEDEDLKYFVLLTAVVSNMEDEIEYAKVKVKFSKIIHIRSLVRFRLNRLYYLWERFANYFNYNFGEIISDEIYLEFLKFIANNSRNNGDIIYLEENQGSLNFKDKNRKIIMSLPKSDEIGVVVNLIVIAPKKLVINCYSSLSSKVAELIEYLFADRVSILL